MPGTSGVSIPSSSDALRGPRGSRGEAGAAGAVGLTGATGPVGIAGEAGAQGIAGVAGLDGIQGPRGDQGSQGIAGPGKPMLTWGALSTGTALTRALPVGGAVVAAPVAHPPVVMNGSGQLGPVAIRALTGPVGGTQTITIRRNGVGVLSLQLAAGVTAARGVEAFSYADGDAIDCVSSLPALVVGALSIMVSLGGP